MQITLEVPDEIAEGLKDLPRALLESFALQRAATAGASATRAQG